MNVEEILKARKKIKNMDDGISPYYPSKKTRTVNDMEISTQGVEMPMPKNKNRNINIDGKKYEIPEFRTNTEEEATLMKKGGKVSSASKRGDGCAVRGKTKGRMV